MTISEMIIIFLVADFVCWFIMNALQILAIFSVLRN
jgi:hypothetical protein